MTDSAKQDEFHLLGLRAVPENVALRILEQSSAGGTVRVENLSDMPLTALTATVMSKPNDLGATVTLSAGTLSGSGTVNLDYSLTAPGPAAAGPVQVRITSAEGAVVDIPFVVNVQELRPRLVATPSSLLAGMVRGGQSVVEFQIVNEGGVASGPITIVLPELPWLHVACTNPLPPLAPGETNVATLLLTPAADLPLGPHSGNLALSSTNASLSVPFEFRALSDAKGGLLLTAVDEYTYYAEGSPNLAGASVIVRDAISQTNVAQGLTDTNGQFFISQLPEAYYEIEVTAPKHTSYRNTTLVAAGVTNEVLAFLSRQAVQYQWTVVPTEVEDRYRIVVETTFETMVPMPVVTIEPSYIDLSELTAGVTQIDVKISNHGLIAAQNMAFRFPQHLRWQVSSIITRLGTLPARSSITVPLLLRRLQTKDGAPDPSRFPVQIDREIHSGWATNAHTGTINGETGWWDGETGGWGEFVYRGAEGDFVPWKVSTSCDPNCLLLAVLSCFNGGDRANQAGCFGGAAGCFYTAWTASSVAASAAGIVDCVVTIGGCVGLLIPPIGCIYTFVRCFYGPASSDGGGGGGPVADVFSASASPHSRLKSGTFSGDAVAPYRRGVRAMFDIFNVLAGTEDGVWFNDATGPNLHEWLQRLKAAASETSEAGRILSDVERVQLLVGIQPEGVSRLEMEHFLDRWNRTMTNWSLGILSPAQLPPGGNPDFCDFNAFREQAAIIAQAQQLAEQNGFTDPLNAIVMTLFTLSQEGQSGGVCARVKLRTEQQAVVSRDAFRAALEIDNSDAGRLEQVEVELTILDQNGQDATALFGIRPPELTGLTGVDGSGVLPGQTTGSVRWEIIPSSDAAPTNPAVYFVAGRLKYAQAGTLLSVPLAPTDITVLPNPRLFLHYFHERDVFSDDPFTDAIEPSVPFNLAVMIQNQGYGAAKKFRLTSAQPQIVENEKGLLIDFAIIATEVAGQNRVPSLTAEFGDINPGQTVIGRWLMTSTLQGLFIDYSASFEHIDALGDQKLSLIEDVNIHEMVHLVQAGGTFEDGKPDFLVNNVADVHDRPDTLWLSDGSTQPVGVVEEATPDGVPTAGDLQVQLTALAPAGWVYLHVPDPADGTFRLARVERSDGRVISLGTNVWVTDRTFIGMARRPAPEYILHLLDYDSTGSYTLTYAPWPVPDTTPPASRVAALPAHSNGEIPVSWTGEDNSDGSGLVSYDIYVSENHGLFAPWLLQTTRNGATYSGAQGLTYSFYSVAVDRAGNREPLPATPDAETRVTLSNRPPALVAPAEQFVDEGREFTFTLTANDPDLPNDRLTFGLSSAPSGMSINPATGLIRWPTGEGNGPSTNHVAVIVQDAGAPPLMATGTLTVVVREVNSAPTLAPIANRTINEGFTLVITNTATDSDLPRNWLSYALGSGVPNGASIDPATGVFTWRPTDTQGPSTNHIVLIVSDNGTPSLSATQQFTVVVRDNRADFTVSLGSTNVLAGESNAVPVRLNSGLELQSLSFDLEVNSALLTDLALQPIAPEVGSAMLLAAGSNHWQLEFTAAPGLALQGTMPIAQLGFTAVSNDLSAIVPLDASGLAGLQSNWQPVTNSAVTDGRVIVIYRDPVLWLERQDSPDPLHPLLSLHLYGQPGREYELQWRTNLSELAPWQSWLDLPLTNRMLQLDWTNDGTPARFLRARER
ncbi:MAG: putative Ig domain-containing protein [Verrucomicrobia bacterium]|nr:putative Ig domain-containing protein [Verrucomicrobiota bacterium]